MQFMILRRADAHSESARLSPEESDLLFATLKPSASALRLTLHHGEASVSEGPFPVAAEMIAGFAIIDVPTKQDAVEWLKRWPAGEHPVELEIRESGCHGGCAQVTPARQEAEGKRFTILLRSSPALEAEAHVPQHVLDTLDAYNAAEAKAGILLAADGLRSSARGARVKVSKNSFSVVDGPFTEIKEMIAGFWLIRAPSLQDAQAWARRIPYPTGPHTEVEIRELYETSQNIERFTPDLESAEQRIRTEQLEAGMRAHFTA